MPGFFPRHTLKQGLRCKKRKERVQAKEENLKTLRKIRIVYSDPDATDYSSEEEEEKFFSNDYQFVCFKRIVKEILVPCVPTKSCAENSSQEARHFSRRKNRLRLGSGTFGTEEEAAMAYEIQKNEFERSSLKASEDVKEVLVQTSPSSVVNVTAAKAAALDTNDINGSVSMETSGEKGCNVAEPVYGEDNSIQHLLEEPNVSSLAGHDRYFLDEMAMLLGGGFYNLLDNEINDGSMWNMDNGEGSSILPHIDSAFDDPELDWFDETLN